MTIVQVKDLDTNDLEELGENVTEAIRIDYEAAMERSLACHEQEPVGPRSRRPPAWTRNGLLGVTTSWPQQNGCTE